MWYGHLSQNKITIYLLRPSQGVVNYFMYICNMIKTPFYTFSIVWAKVVST